jgi:hypothetical protein
MRIGKRRALAVLTVATVGFGVVVGGVVDGTAAGRSTRALSLGPPRHTAEGGEGLREAWPVGVFSTVWAWTANLSGHGGQGVQLSTDGGRAWIDVTPPGLGEQVGDHVINGLFALDRQHA